MIGGGCFCGAVRFEADGPVSHETLCHCAICRGVSAAPVVAWVSFPAGALRVTRGAPKEFRSSGLATRSFCAQCGTPLFFRHDHHPGEIDVTTCSLDEPERFPPKDHTWASRRLPWLAVEDGLPRHAEARPPDPLASRRREE